MKWCQEGCSEELRDFRFAEMRSKDSLPCPGSLSGSDVPEPVGLISPAVSACSFSKATILTPRTRAQIGNSRSPMKGYLEQLMGYTKTPDIN